MAFPLSTDALRERIEALLRSREPDARDVRIDGLRPLSGGNARKAWSFAATLDGTRRDCVLLARVERGQLDVDPRFEFEVLRRLAPAGLPVPAAYWADPQGEVLGMPGLVMQCGEGRSDIVELLQPACASTRSLARDLLGIAARLHQVPFEEAAAPWQPHGLLAQWRGQFEAVRMEPLPALACVFDWLEDHVPAPCRPALVHGDLRIGNFLHDGQRVTMLLDWELAHFGDPAEDVAWMYRRLWSPQAFLSLDEGLAAYRDAGGAAIDAARLVWHRVFAEARLAVISLAALRRFIDGETQNLRHAGRGSMVNECLLAALQWIEEAEAAC